MRILPTLTLLGLLLSSCGVKAPPVAPVRTGDTLEQNLNCSPYDENCDATDPDYRPVGR